MISDINTDARESASREIGTQFMAHDVSNEADWENVLNVITQAFGQLHIMVNNAGMEDSHSAEDSEHTSLESWNRIMAVNVGGIFLGCKYAIPAIRSSGDDPIINMSFIAALVATPFITVLWITVLWRQQSRCVTTYHVSYPTLCRKQL